MPIYEYRCAGCRRRVQIFFRSFSSVDQAQCPICQSTDLTRLPSRVSIVRSESSSQDYLADPSNLADVDYEDPRAVAEWAKRMGDAAGLEMGSDYDEMIDQIESGADLGDSFGMGGGDSGDLDL